MKHIFWVLCLMPFCMLSQINDAPFETEVQKPQINLKLDFTGLVNPFSNSSGLGIDYFLDERMQLQAVVGYYFYSLLRSDQKGESYRGLKTQLGFNYLFKRRGKDFSYVGILLNSRFINNTQYKNISVQNQFIETKLTKRRVTSIGNNIIYGNQWYLGSKQKVFIEWYLGIGVKYNWVKNIDETNCTFCEDEFIFDFELDEGFTITPDGYIFGLNIGYTLK